MELTETTESTIECPKCHQLVDDAFYSEHVTGNPAHTLHVVKVKGAGTTTLVGDQQKKEPWMLDIPYLGRVTGLGFVILCLFWLAIGVLFGARII